MRARLKAWWGPPRSAQRGKARCSLAMFVAVVSYGWAFSLIDAGGWLLAGAGFVGALASGSLFGFALVRWKRFDHLLAVAEVAEVLLVAIRRADEADPSTTG